MNDEGSAVKAEQGAAAEARSLTHADWLGCWDTVEALARDADRLYAKCGTSCSVEELSQWRELILAQLAAALQEEARIFAALRETREVPQGEPPAATLDNAA